MTPAQQQFVHVALATAACNVGFVLHDEVSVRVGSIGCDLIPAGHPQAPMAQAAHRILAAVAANTNTPAHLPAV